MSRDAETLDRRDVLKTIGSTALVGSGLGVAAGSGAARSDDLAAGYRDERRLRLAFDRHGARLLETLVEAGIVPEDFDFHSLRFDLDADATGLEPVGEDGRGVVTSVRDGATPSALGMVSTSIDGYDVNLYVQPERDLAYALVEPRGSDERLLATGDGVSPADCTYIECSQECCSSGFSYEYVYECYDSCSGTCYVTSKTCSCSSIC